MNATATVTARTIEEFSRSQVWAYIAENNLPVKKLSSTAAARQALLDYLESDLDTVDESEYLEAEIETETETEIDEEPDLEDACDNDNDPDPDEDVTDNAIVDNAIVDNAIVDNAIVYVEIEPEAEPATATELVKSISVAASALSQLSTVSSIAKTKHWGLKYDGGILSASSVRGEITVTDRIAVGNSAGSWATCVDDTFTAFLKKLKSGEFVTLDTTAEDILKLNSDRGCLDVNINRIDLTPEQNIFEGKVITTFTCGAESLIKAVKNVAPCRSIDRNVLKSVLVKINGSTVNLVATDGSRVAVAKAELLTGSIKPKAVILLPSGMVDGLASMAGSVSGGMKITIDISKTHIRASFSNSNLELVSYKPENCYANVDPLIDMVNAAESVSITFDTATVRDRLAMLAPITKSMVAATVTLTLDSSGHAHIIADNNKHIADTGFEYTGTAIDRSFEFNYGFFLHGLSTGNESIELSLPVDVALVKLTTPAFVYYLAPLS